MTQFQVVKEQGFIRSLSAKKPYKLPTTPWLLEVVSGRLMVGEQEIVPITVDQNLTRESMPHGTIPIYTPLLTPDEEFLESNEYEYDLFLDRLVDFKPEGLFGLTFDPKKQSEEQLEAALDLKPSIISLRTPPLSKSSPKEWIKNIYEIRQAIPPDIAVYLPRTGYKGLNTLLIAMGIDIIDNVEAYLVSLERISFQDGFAEVRDMELKDLIEENLKHISNDFKAIRESIEHNTIWQRLYREMHVSPTVASYVKHLQKIKFDYSKWGFNQSNNVMFIGDEALKHPEVLAFQDRLRKRYAIPKGKRVVVLLPCSAKKPYHRSRSHKLFEKSINNGFKGLGRLVEIWSLTSPLGVVPRELETLYPARTYDIPVSGDWSAEEISATVNILNDLLNNLPTGIPVIAHVSSGYRPIIEEIQKKHELNVSWADEKPASRTALNHLEKTLREIRPSERIFFSNKALIQHWIDMAIVQAKWQHGKEFELDTEGWRFKGKPPRPIAIQKNNQHYATWDIENGQLRLFPQAILDSNLKTVSWARFDGNELNGSSLFIPGIQEASSEISPGDEVIILNTENEPIGVGDALVSGSTMNKASSGAGIKIRKKIEVK
ncbi:MAG: hypothetical protein D6732_05115 [Methanobacteriota archaeon]|nr:MAG: hypothetical protein D6732_05115 [Euryarchaeota archaeon]